jgi:hypothetical protein
MIDYTNYLNVDHLPITRYLKDNYQAIATECDNMLANMELAPKPKSVSMGQHGRNRAQVGKPMIEGDVFSAYLLLRPELLDDNEREIVYQPGREKSRGWRRLQNPTLMRFMLPYRDCLGNVGFNQLHPGARINPHYGVSTDYFRMHLCIHGVPGATFFLKDRAPYTWKDGEVMAFADGDMLHWVEHNGDRVRTILSIDVLKSELTRYPL